MYEIRKDKKIKNLIVKKEFQVPEALNNMSIVKSIIKSDYYMTHNNLDKESNQQNESPVNSVDPHFIQRRRYFNTRRGV